MKNVLVYTVIGFASILLFGAGVLVGRNFPIHNFEKLPNSSYLLDSSTGKICYIDFPNPIDPSDNSIEEGMRIANDDNAAKAKLSFPVCPTH
jgi:hypothetical protein